MGGKSVTPLPAAKALSLAQFAQLEDVPPEIEWFANLTNLNTRRAYKSDVRGFMAFLSIERPEELRRVARAHVLAWRKTLNQLAPASVRRKLAAVSSLFEYLCERNAVLANPASGVQRPKEGANEGKTPVQTARLCSFWSSRLPRCRKCAEDC